MILAFIQAVITSDVATELVTSASTSPSLDWTWIFTFMIACLTLVGGILGVINYLKPASNVKEEALRKSEYLTDIKNNLEKEIADLKEKDTALDNDLKNILERFNNIIKESIQELKDSTKETHNNAQNNLAKELKSLIDEHKRYIDTHGNNNSQTEKNIQEMQQKILEEQRIFAKKMDELLLQMLDMFQ